MTTGQAAVAAADARGVGFVKLGRQGGPEVNVDALVVSLSVVL